MVAGLKFLSKKSFNPQNSNNQKTVWERQQERAQVERRVQEREKQLQRERDDEELQRARGEAPRLAFLYAVPPGLEARAREGEGEDQDKSDGDNSLETNAHPIDGPTASASAPAHHRDEKNKPATPHEPTGGAGNLDPAAAFREFLESAKRRAAEREEAAASADGGGSGNVKDGSPNNNKKAPGSFGTVLQGTSHDPVQAALENSSSKPAAGPSALSALEKAVGRKHQHAASGSLSLEEQIQRFPALANAPRQKGISASHVGVSFQPLGAQIRNVRCMACGIWGHSRGERECRVTGWDPFEAAANGSGSINAGAAPASQERGPPAAERRSMQQRQSRRDAHDDDERRRRQYGQVGSTSPSRGGVRENGRGDTDSERDDGDNDDGSRDSRRRNHHRRQKKRKHKSKHKRSHSQKKRSRARRSESGGEGEGSGSDSESSRPKRKKHRKHRDRDDTS